MTAQDLAPLLQQAVDLDERVARARPAPAHAPRRGSSAANRNEPSPGTSTAKHRSTSRASSAGAGRRPGRPRRRPRPRRQWPSSRWTTPAIGPASSHSAPLLRALASSPSTSGSDSVSKVPWSTDPPDDDGSNAVHRLGGRSLSGRRGVGAAFESRQVASAAAAAAPHRVERRRPGRSSARPAARPGAPACRARRRPRAPRPRAAASSGVSSGWYTRSATTWPASQRRRAESGARRRRAIPTGVAFTTMSAAAAAVGAVVPGDRSAVRASGRGLGGRRARAARDHDPARRRRRAPARPPGPRRPRRARAPTRPATSTSASAQRPQEARRRRSSRRSSRAVGRERDGVDAPQRGRAGRELVAQRRPPRSCAASSPTARRSPSARAASSAAARAAVGHLERDEHPVEAERLVRRVVQHAATASGAPDRRSRRRPASRR